jgi:[ribosomal protein S5]-alanine N-acetyltransferase
LDKPARMPSTPVLSTDRLLLRPVDVGDVMAVEEGFSQWDVVKHLDAAVPWPLPHDWAASEMSDTLRCMARGEKCRWAITLKGDDKLIGAIELRTDDGTSRNQRAFWLSPRHWRRGLMTEAAEKVTEFAFLTLGWSQLWLTNAEANSASQRIKEKQGARIVDRKPGRYVSGDGVEVTWLLTREYWLARRDAQAGAFQDPTAALAATGLARPLLAGPAPGRSSAGGDADQAPTGPAARLRPAADEPG